MDERSTPDREPGSVSFSDNEPKRFPTINSDSSTDREPDDLERVLAGQCIHGQGPSCVTCALTRYQAVTLRRLLGALLR